jgi:hypothetical protein
VTDLGRRVAKLGEYAGEDEELEEPVVEESDTDDDEEDE